MAESSFKSAVDKLDSAFRTGHVYAPWIRFKVGSLDIETSSEKRNYFLSMQNERNGSGQANKFTINIAYVPAAENNNSQEADVDIIDKELAVSGLECTLQYGYSYPVELKSPEYVGKILDYQVEIRDGALFYTITGYSGLVSLNEQNITTDKYSNKKPTEIVEDIYNKYLKDQGYELEFENNCKGTDKQLDGDIDITTDVNVFEYMSSILSKAEYESDNENTSASEKSTYQYIINDIKDSKKIVVQRICPKDLLKNAPKVVFNWMAPNKDGGNLVINFTTAFKGAILLAQTYKENDKDFQKYGLNEKGEKVEAYSRYSPTSGAKAEDDAKSTKTTWAEATQHSYTATLTTLGIPSHIQISERMQIIPIINGKAHHTQGTYMITKISDQIDSGGFITSFELIKLGTETAAEKDKKNNSQGK